MALLWQLSHLRLKKINKYYIYVQKYDKYLNTEQVVITALNPKNPKLIIKVNHLQCISVAIPIMMIVTHYLHCDQQQRCVCSRVKCSLRSLND